MIYWLVDDGSTDLLMFIDFVTNIDWLIEERWYLKPLLVIIATLFRSSSSFWTNVVDVVEQDDKLLSWFSISIIAHNDHEDKTQMRMITVGIEGDDMNDDDNKNDGYNDGFCQR